MAGEKLWLRPAVNVEDLKQRDALVRRGQRIRAEAVQALADVVHWNRAHPNEEPLPTDYWMAVIDWIDGKGSMPAAPEGERPC